MWPVWSQSTIDRKCLSFEACIWAETFAGQIIVIRPFQMICIKLDPLSGIQENWMYRALVCETAKIKPVLFSHSDACTHQRPNYRSMICESMTTDTVRGRTEFTRTRSLLHQCSVCPHASVTVTGDNCLASLLFTPIPYVFRYCRK